MAGVVGIGTANATVAAMLRIMVESTDVHLMLRIMEESIGADLKSNTTATSGAVVT
jgi:hypothetical protein